MRPKRRDRVVSGESGGDIFMVVAIRSGTAHKDVVIIIIIIFFFFDGLRMVVRLMVIVVAVVVAMLMVVMVVGGEEGSNCRVRRKGNNT